MFCLTFDVCEPTLGMSFPEWNGIALDMETFDRMIWNHPGLEPCDPEAHWNVADMAAFLEWHRTTAPHHNYVVGGAVFRKRAAPCGGGGGSRASRTVRVHQIDTGLGSGNTGDDAMFLAAHAHLPARFALTTEVHSLGRTALWPEGVGYIDVRDEAGIAESIEAADMAMIMGDTPVMDAWGLDWPLRANARKLDRCHRLGKPVHCVGVGVDRLEDPEAIEIFHRSYLPISTWSVRSEPCRQALIALGVPERRIVLGADWAWLLPVRIDRDWAMAQLGASGYDPSKVHVGVNLVHERWRDDERLRHTWAEILDCLVEAHDSQVFFLCNESRLGDYYDRAAAQAVQSLMRHPSALVAGQYFTPDQMLSLVASVDVTISQRYHFTLFSILAEVIPVSIERGQKMKSLNADLGLPFVGDMDDPEAEAILSQTRAALEHREERLVALRRQREILSRRALLNFSLIDS
jgi:polysaccharide pyruvyl transferase WcaK-like protein